MTSLGVVNSRHGREATCVRETRIGLLHHTSGARRGQAQSSTRDPERVVIESYESQAHTLLQLFTLRVYPRRTSKHSIPRRPGTSILRSVRLVSSPVPDAWEKVGRRLRCNTHDVGDTHTHAPSAHPLRASSLRDVQPQ
eukprot:245762-Prorocentrum_minimum.AAC.2